MLEIFSTAEAWVSLLTLTALEVVLGIDNIVFISILAGKLPAERQAKARRLGLSFALITRIALLFAISWIMGLNEPLFAVAKKEISGRALILLVGGIFLIFKATKEIFDKLEVEEHETAVGGATGMTWIIVQIMLLDVVFSLDSVITAVGMVPHIPIMMTAMVLAVLIMMVFAGPVGDFVNRHPSMKILALAFLLLIGVLLTAEAFGQHVDKGYIYFAMGFSLLVELINMRVRKSRQKPVVLHSQFKVDRPPAA
jgi:predicted tellurium resistance membrane protein TerC